MKRKVKKNKLGSKKSFFLVSELLHELGKKYPLDTAESWDNVGLIVGDPKTKITSVVVAINLGPEALAKAVETKSNTIVCHHPPIFKAITKITQNKMPYLMEAIRRKISVIALHTNYDLGSKTVNELISEKLGLSYQSSLVGREGQSVVESMKLFKFVTYVPPKSLEKVKEAVFRAGAGHIGNYSHCSFASEGLGSFLGDGGTNPAIGKPGVLEKTPEIKLETVVPAARVDSVVNAAKQAHPYEEMAYDLFELKQSIAHLGYGFVANAKTKGLNFHNFIEGVKRTFQLKKVLVSGPGAENSKIPIRRVGFSPGSGSSFVSAACAKNLDVYVCGEVGYHHILEARQKGLTLVVLGHSYSEHFFLEEMKRLCSQKIKARLVTHSVYEKIEVVF